MPSRRMFILGIEDVVLMITRYDIAIKIRGVT